MKKTLCLLLAAAMLLCGAGCSRQDSAQSGSVEPVNIVIWTYYNGDTLNAFETLTSRFNDTVGRELGIYVSTYSYGSAGELEADVLSSAYGEAGADEMPDIFMAYADTAYAMDQMGLLVDIGDYMSEDELSLFVDGYIREGDLIGDGRITIFPTAKSTEILCLNKTDWDRFSRATGASTDSLSTMEGVVSTAEAYYEWTDSLTPEPFDGKAFFGYDAVDNYILIGAMQLGTEILQSIDGEGRIDFNRDTARKLWDNFYIPFVKGHFCASGRFRSDDVKTGLAIAYVGSSASATYFPKQVIVSDTESYPIEMLVLPCPQFAGGESVIVQQGAGMAITKSTGRRINASIEFLKWFTAPENNIAFSVNSGYLPVTDEGNNIDTILSSDAAITGNMEQVIRTAVTSMQDRQLYTPRAFNGGTEARNILKYSLQDRAIADRRAILAAYNAGTPMEDAIARYLTDETFEQWYAQANRELQACLE